ncbi:hypothetical protein BD324DRAFT_651798 [Kockovaella imperatae]|uniref:V-SNARE coiled-coil homology domain-containing protein n=1 Tax=Kockovaella imperatae TaxID=4999 RepID=A0A1Y1UCY3_9TREE|nr:hypothetical protein BD324DRAFT_651798 [Kockovaella imperatae]ORX35883.1 hypothetical protein BD324DRAFT_651798 [Kockovaella imperatae]
MLIPKDQPVPPAQQGNSKQMDKIQATKQHIDEATAEFSKTIEAIHERGERLEDLRGQERSLEYPKSEFQGQGKSSQEKDVVE